MINYNDGKTVVKKPRVIEKASDANDIKQLKMLVSILYKKVEAIEERLSRVIDESKSTRDATKGLAKRFR